MNLIQSLVIAMTTMVATALPTYAQEEKKTPKTKAAIERGLNFVKEDALKWQERNVPLVIMEP